MSILSIILFIVFGYAVVSCFLEQEKGAAVLGIIIVAVARFGGAYASLNYYPEYANIIMISSFVIYVFVILWLLAKSGTLFDRW